MDKGDLWDVVEQARSHYQEHHYSVKALEELVDEWSESNRELDALFDEAADVVDTFMSRVDSQTVDCSSSSYCRLQLYELNEDEYAFRVLEPDYFFHNELGNDIEEIERLDYDGRTDITEEEEEIEDEVMHVVDMQRERKYMTVPIFQRQDMDDVWINLRRTTLKNAIKDND